MAQYKTAPFDALEHTVIARRSYLEYERNEDQPDESEIEADWRRTLQDLKLALQGLTKRQRKIVVMIVVQRKTETAVAKELELNQSTVSRQYAAALAKMRKILTK